MSAQRHPQAARSGSASRSGARRSPIGVLVVEDHALLRSGVVGLLGLEGDLQCLGACADGASALRALARLDPDVLLVDLMLPDRPGTALIAEALQRKPRLRALVLTGHADREHIERSLLAGALGYVVKSSGAADLLSGIRAVAAGQTFLCSTTLATIASRPAHWRPPGDGRSGAGELTERERQILVLVAVGRSNKLIARELGLSDQTVEKHRSNAMRKFGLHSATDARRFALQSGLVDASAFPPSAIPTDSTTGRSRT
ncbi:MAG: response regulator transcription factor [Proteobacteria bacterium]|nr:response regulator transcription factor [Pseudomonadota bacterium]